MALVLAAGCATPKPPAPTAPPQTGEETSSTTSTAAAVQTTKPAPSVTSTSTTSATTLPPWTPGPWRLAACDRTEAAPPNHPDIVALDGNFSLRAYSWDGSAYTNRSWVSGVRHLATMGRSVFTAEVREGSWTLVKRDTLLRTALSKPMPPIGDMSVTGTRLYVVTNWNLTVYDSGLREVGRLAMQPPYPNPGSAKSLDDVDVHAGIAYVVDDVAMPYWVFKASVQNTRSMQILHRHDLNAINGGPFAQWLDPRNSTWYVGGRSSTIGGATTFAITIRSDGTLDGNVPLSASTYRTGASDTRTHKREGYAVLGGGFLLPAWSVLAQGEEVELARMAFNGTVPERSCPAPLWPGARAVHDAGATIVVGGGGQLAVLDAAGKESHRQDVDGDIVRLRALP